MPLLEDVGRLAIDLVQFMVKKSLRVPAEEIAKHIECSLKRALCWGCLLAFCLILLLTGMGLIIWGLYTLLSSSMGSGQAALVIGFVVSLLAILLVVIVKLSKR
jgi:thiosulfate reductase cytochrome b subunit